MHISVRSCLSHIQASSNSVDKRLLDILVCPVTKGKLIVQGDELWSRQAALAYPVRDSLPVLLETEARQLSLAEVESLKETR